MRTFDTHLIETRLYPQGIAGLFRCPAHLLPSPGQYYQAWALDDLDNLLPINLHPATIEAEAFLSAPSLPPSWQAGIPIGMRGPLGKGFRLPARGHNIALVALGDQAMRLFPLLMQALAQGCAVTLFADCELPLIPAAVEIFPLEAIPETLSWPDYLACDVPDLDSVKRLAGFFSLGPIPFPGQVLVNLPMPCGGLAECGICALPTRQGKWQFSCMDGPVFELHDLIFT